MHAYEQATLGTFVEPVKRERMLALLGSRKRRRKALGELNHFSSWDRRFAHGLPGSMTSTELIRLLKRAGTRGDCYILSDNPELDGQELSLAEAIGAAETAQFASLVCCIPRKLACYFYEMEKPRVRILLQIK